MTTTTTKLISHTLTSVDCPTSASFSKIHGPAAPNANLTFNLRAHSVLANRPPIAPIHPPLGSLVSITCDKSSFYGYVTSSEIVTDDNDGSELLNVTICEWRDRLHDHYIFAAYNMFEENGACWHIHIEDWLTQIKTYISKEMDQIDFDALQEENTKSGKLKIVSQQRLLSAATILNILKDRFQFNWTCCSLVKNLLQITKPFNIDWQNGITGADALEDLLSKMNLRWTTKGTDTIVITQNGARKNYFLDAYLDGIGTMCNLNGRNASRGQEINEKGRFVLIIGERNRHQFIFPCQIDWNQRFNARLCYDGWTLAALMHSLGLNPLSKLKEMPIEYQDDRTWMRNPDGFGMGALNNKKTRNEMTIHDYIKNICFKVYRIDFGYACEKVQMNVEEVDYGSGFIHTIDKRTLQKFKQSDPNANPPVQGEKDVNGIELHQEGTIDEYPFYYPGHFLKQAVISPTTEDDSGFMYNDYNSLWTISQSLVTETNAQFIPLHTTRSIIMGKQYPFEKQRHFVPTNQGATIEIEEIVSPKTGKQTYIGRLVFSNPQVIFDDLKKWRDPNTIKADKILVVLSLDKDIYHFEKGTSQGAKVRTQKHNVKSLYRSFVDEKEVVTLAENHQIELKKGGAIPATKPVKADDIARRIADNLLFHAAVSKMGFMKFKHTATHNPDETIDSISVNFTDNDGLVETINFSHSRKLPGIAPLPPSIYRVSKELKTESKVNRERLEQIGKEAMKDLGKIGFGGYSYDDVMGTIGSLATAPSIEKVINGGLDNQDTIQVKVNVDEIEDKKIDEGDVLILGD